MIDSPVALGCILSSEKGLRMMYWARRSRSCTLYNRNKVPLDKNPTDFNLVWQGGAQASVHLTPKLPGATSNVLPWEEWVALGQDVHSKVADPLFVDASKDDYRLKPDSPAREFGFQESPLDRIGPYRDELRATWPILE
jgi:hypothetical protein